MRLVIAEGPANEARTVGLGAALPKQEGGTVQTMLASCDSVIHLTTTSLARDLGNGNTDDCTGKCHEFYGMGLCLYEHTLHGYLDSTVFLSEGLSVWGSRRGSCGFAASLVRA